MQGVIENKIYRILNDGELSDDKKILSILSSPPSLNTFPIGFVTILDIIKEDNPRFVDEYQKIILDFLKIYSTSSSDLIEKNSLFNDKFTDILFNYYFYNNSKSLLNNFLTLISSSISQTIVWSDFDPSSDVLKDSSRSSSPDSSQVSSRSSSPPQENPVFLGLTPESLLPLPIATSDNGPVDKSGTTVTSQVVPDKADSQEFNQGSSAIIVAQQNQQGDLFPLPIRLYSNDQKLLQLPQMLGLNGDQASQQNIDSSPVSVVFSHQNQEVNANDSVMQNSTASSQGTFPMPKRLESGYPPSDVSSTIPNGVSVEPLQPNLLASSSNAGSGSLPNLGEEKPKQDESGEKKTGCFDCLFSRVREGIKRCFSGIKMSGSLKFFSASCLGSSTKTRVGP